MNDDGKLDFFVAGDSGNVRYYKRNADMARGAIVDIFSFGENSYPFSLHDWNGYGFFDMLILTVNNNSPATESLAIWQRMKGYGVKVELASSWSESEIKSTIASFYNNTSQKPGYVILPGDVDAVPSNR